MAGDFEISILSLKSGENHAVEFEAFSSKFLSGNMFRTL